MSVTHPFRFAVQSFSAPSGAAWRETARKTEDLGYSALHLADHFLGPGPAIEKANHPVQSLAAIPAMAVAAEATSTLRIGCRVFCIDYHHPAMLAKEAATLDLFSDGRLEFGLGAGWIKSEYEAAGIQFDPPGKRIARLREAIAAIKALMSPGPIQFDGEHYAIHDFEGSPQPIQQPHPPIMVGGGGRRILTLAAQEANVVSFNFDNSSGMIGPAGVQSSTAAATAEKIAWVRSAAEAAGRADEIELEIGAYFTVVTPDGRPAAESMAAAFGLSVEEMLEHPHALIGSVDTVCAELERRRDLYGISYVTVPYEQAQAFAPIVARLAGR